MHSLKLLLLVILLFGCEKEEFNSSKIMTQNESLKEKIATSIYDWEKKRKLTVCITSPKDGMITLSAINGEMIYKGYLLNGVLHEYVLTIPFDVTHVLIEHSEYTKIFDVESGSIKHDFK